MSNDDAKRIAMTLEGMADCYVEQWAGDIGYARVMREELTALLRHVRAETLLEASMLADERARVLLIEAVHESQCQGRALEVFAAQLAVMARAKEGQ